jgi:hypothetical protein
VHQPSDTSVPSASCGGTRRYGVPAVLLTDKFVTSEKIYRVVCVYCNNLITTQTTTNKILLFLNMKKRGTLGPFAHSQNTLLSHVMSVHLSSCISVSPTRRISVKFDTGNFHENLSRDSKFVYNRKTPSGTLHEDLRIVNYCRAHKFAVKAFLCKIQYF